MNKKNSWISWALCSFLLAFSAGQAAADDESVCAAPLSQALMTIRADTRSNDQNAANSAWQCSFKFSSHDEAIKGGLSVGAVVYGVPLKIGGSFDKKQVDQWKEENCSKSASNSSFEAASLQYLREVAPGAMTAFADCIAQHQNFSAVACSVSRSSGVYKLWWRRSNGEQPEAAPIVSRLVTSNGSCPGIEASSVVNEGGLATACSSEAGKDLVVVADTSRGACVAIAPYEKSRYTVVGTLRLDSDKQITADVVDFKEGARIVINGSILKIQASELEVTGEAAIVSFDASGPARAPGTAGRSAGSLVIRTGNITGGDLRIDLSGEDGVAGAAGMNGVKGPKGEDGAGRGLQGIKGCGGGHDASPGGPGTAGKDGDSGGNGGNGGVVLIQMQGAGNQNASSHFNVVAQEGHPQGGKGGPGGNGGIGGPGGDGGAKGNGHNGCGGRPGAGPGPKGPDGKPGRAGSPGSPGSVTIE